MLKPDHYRFVLEYAKDSNATQAAIRAGYSADSAGTTGSRLLEREDIQKVLAEHQADLAVAAQISASWVLRQWWMIAEADPNELMRVDKRCCRNCYGLGHAYQWTESEYTEQVEKSIKAAQPAPDASGGFGFDLNAQPNPECPECGGNGVESVFLADTGKLSGNARRLFAGVQKTKDGVKILTRDQDAALANIARYLGMTTGKLEISGPGGGAIPLATLKAEDLTDDQLAAILVQAVPDAISP